MNRRLSMLALLAATSLTAACAQTVAAPVAIPAAAAEPAAVPAMSQQAAHDALFALFKQSDEANLRRNPLERPVPRRPALCRPARRLSSRDEYFAAESAAAEDELAALARSTARGSSPTDRIAYDVFELATCRRCKGFEPELLALTVVRPVNHFSGFHTFYPTFACGKSAAPFKTVARL